MREIKFRAWEETEEHMYNWENLLSQNLKNIFVIPEQCGYNIMQYTGLKDKNGQEIYEGDIVFIKGNTELLDIKGKVEYNNSLAQFIITNTGDIINEEEPLGDYAREDLEVIGNVWEDSDLLNDN